MSRLWRLRWMSWLRRHRMSRLWLQRLRLCRLRRLGHFLWRLWRFLGRLWFRRLLRIVGRLPLLLIRGAPCRAFEKNVFASALGESVRRQEFTTLLSGAAIWPLRPVWC